jgi:periplasmic protein TonB
VSVHSTSVVIRPDHSFVSGSQQEGHPRHASSGTVLAGVALTVLMHGALLVGVRALHASGPASQQPEVSPTRRSRPLMVELHTIALAVFDGRAQSLERTGEEPAHRALTSAPPRRSTAHSSPRVVRLATEEPPAAEAVAASGISGSGEGVAAVGGIAGPGSASTGKCCGNGLGGDGATASLPTRLPARPVYNPRPVYPRQARLMGWEGSVVLRVLVDTQGNAADVAVVSGSGQAVLDQSAVETVRRWRFSPAMEAGKPVTMVHDVRIRFRLDDYPA